MKLLYFLFCLSIAFNVYCQEEESKKEISGFIQPAFVYYFDSEKIPNNEFKLYRTRMGFVRKIGKNFSGQIEIDPSDRQIIKDAKINMSLTDYITIEFGRQKMPFSLERLTSIEDLIFIDRAKIVNEMDDLGYCGRDLGVVFSTNFYISSINIELNFGIFNGNKNFSTEDNNNSKTFVQRLTIKKDKNFTVGINSSQKVDSISTNFFVGNGIDLSYTPWKNFTITSEILYGRKSSKSLIGGAYLGFDYKIKKFNFGLRYSKYYKNLELSGEDFIQSKIDWHLNKKFKLIFNYEVSHSTIQKFNSKLILASTYEI